MQKRSSYRSLIWFLLFYRTGVIKLVCDKDNPGKLDPFVEVEDKVKKTGTYVSGI